MGKPPVAPKSPFCVKMTVAKAAPCPMCRQPHRLYQLEAFKSKSPKQRLISTQNALTVSVHLYTRKCKSTIRCKLEGCGQAHHTLLHFHEPKEEVDQGTVNQNSEVNQDSVADQCTSCNASTHSVSAVNDSSEVLLEVILAVKS